MAKLKTFKTHILEFNESEKCILEKLFININDHLFDDQFDEIGISGDDREILSDIGDLLYSL